MHKLLFSNSSTFKGKLGHLDLERALIFMSWHLRGQEGIDGDSSHYNARVDAGAGDF